MPCQSCQLVTINGIPCHETGCPDSHVGTVRECDWCGSEFEPEERRQRFCSDDCAESFHS
jgi:hypothetical protein